MPQAKRKVVLTELLVRKAKAEGRVLHLTDIKAPGLVLWVQPTGHRAFKYSYSFGGCPRVLHLGWLYLKDARRIAFKWRASIAEGRDPWVERQAARGITFGDLHQRYLKEHAQKRNKSWPQAAALIQRHVTAAVGKERRQEHHQSRRAVPDGRHQGTDRGKPVPRSRVRGVHLGGQPGGPQRQPVPRGRDKSNDEPRARSQRQ